MKRIFDIIFSFLGIAIISVPLLILMFIVWCNDFSFPLYISNRVGKDGKVFKMYKLRSMIPNADKSNVNSTSLDDPRITKVGKVIRKYKFDEGMQLLNVFFGDMSVVGPRPNILSETKMYTNEENKILNIKPGITDFSSIVFSDEADILHGSNDPDLSYNQLIRPWKSRLGIIYLEYRSFFLDIQIIFYTVIALISKDIALNWIGEKLESFKSDRQIIDVSLRREKLYPFPPPGSNKIVQ